MKKKKAVEKSAVLGLAGLAGAAAFAAGTDAYAYTVRYDGTFVFCSTGGSRYCDGSQYLDITKPASEQVGVTEGFLGSLDRLYFYYGRIVGGIGSNFMVANKSGYDSFAGGEIIDGSLNFSGSGEVMFSSYTKYFGVKLPGDRFGWIMANLDADGGFNRDFSALAWGYETEPGVGIAVGAPMAPEPGSLAMLATGAAVLVGSKRLRRKR
ncbi:MAG: PEP-CTERM sorting domain-containing protein [Nitrospiraceae bacterium]|nr:MAG: PEP-CTERM sorting domain-containing protein [Nitrospiraceae bacterium]